MNSSRIPQRNQESEIRTKLEARKDGSQTRDRTEATGPGAAFKVVELLDRCIAREANMT
jgi:hypothetical protein